MSKKLKTVTENLKRSYKMKHYIIFVFFLTLAVNEVYASTLFRTELEKTSKQKAIRKRTLLEVLEIENADCGLHKILSNNSTNQTEGKAEGISLSFEINKYKHMQDRIFNFDDSIRYDSVTIYEDDNGTNASSRSSHDLCVRFIKAFRNLQAKKLIIRNIYLYIEFINLIPEILLKDSPSESILDVEEIVFEDVCKSFALRVLDLFEFKYPVRVVFIDTYSYRQKNFLAYPNPYELRKNRSNIRTIVFENIGIRSSSTILNHLRFKELVEIIYISTDKDFQLCSWGDLTVLRRFHRCKMIYLVGKEIEDFTNLIGNKKEKLEGILPVLYINRYDKIDKKHNNYLCPKLQNIIKRSKFFYEGIDAAEYPSRKNEFDLLHSSSKSIYLTVDATRICGLLNDKNDLSDKTVICTNNCYNYSPSTELFKVHIRINSDVLTFLQIKKALQWTADHVSNATRIIIIYPEELHEDVSAFESKRIEVESMPHLEYVALRHYRDQSHVDTIVLRDINCKERYVRTMTNFDLIEDHTLGVPLNLHIHGIIKTQKKLYPVRYCKPEETNILTVCEKCGLKVFKHQEDQEEPKTTEKVLSLKELKPMTWKKFLASSSRESIEKHLKIAYDLDRDIKLDSEEKFMLVLDYLFEKPIVVLPKCLHSICAGCIHEETRIKGTIKCSWCQEWQDLSQSFRYFVRERNPTDIEDKYIFSAAIYGSKSQETQYILYECAPFQSSKYYLKSLREITKPNFIIRKDERMCLKRKD